MSALGSASSANQGSGSGNGPVEALTEVAGRDAADVLEESEQVRASRNQWTPHVVLRQPVELPEQCVASDLQVVVQVVLEVTRGTVMAVSLAEPRLKATDR